MAHFVPPNWVEERLDSEELLILDPRRPVRYLQGHLKNAVNLPLSRLLDSEGAVLPVGELARRLGEVGLNSNKVPLLYDEYDGQQGAMVACLLAYLGRDDVHLMELFLEGWLAQKREIFYRPVKSSGSRFEANPNPSLVAEREDILDNAGLVLIDFRSPQEYTGERDTEGTPGHIPGARNVDWRRLVGEGHRFLKPARELQEVFAGAGVEPGQTPVAYCRMGPRAALGFLALQAIGCRPRLYAGSYREWVRSALPVEV